MLLKLSILDFGFDKRLERMLANARDPRPLLAAVGQVFVAGAKRAFREQGRDGAVWKPSWRAKTTGGQTLVKSGALRRSIAFVVDGVTRFMVGVWGVAAKSAGVHQFGAVIRPVKGRMLAIPIGDVKGSPRDFPNTFIEAGRGLSSQAAQGKVERGRYFRENQVSQGPGDRRRVIVFQETARGVRALFLLVPSVTIPARPFLGYGPWEQSRVKRLVARHLKGEDVAPAGGEVAGG